MMESKAFAPIIHEHKDIHALVEKLTNIILAFVLEEHGKKFERLEEMDSWLVETEKDDLGISRGIRDFFKTSGDVIRAVDDFFKDKAIEYNSISWCFCPSMYVVKK